MPRPAGQVASLYFDYPDYAVAPRPHAPDEADVVIAGAGPVGLCAALALARQGVASVVLDPKTSVSDGSRAICIARHSLEILQQIGVDRAFTAKALPWTHGTSYYRDRAVFRLAMPHGPDERFHPMYNLQQQYIEAFLVAAAQADPLIDLRFGHRLVDLRNVADGVDIEVTCPDGAYPLHTRYAIAADGARSRVREALGLQLHGGAHEARYVIVDVKLRSAHPTERRAFFDPAANPGATILVHRQPDDIWRIDYQLGEDEDEETALAEASIRARLAPILEMLGEDDDWALEWWSLYKAYTLCLDDYRAGNVFFVGDAAHLVPIFGVRGLNSGFADAADIAWKLAWVLRGWAAPTLLDSYSPERRGATLDIFEQAGRSTRFMSPPTRGHRLLRDAALALAATHASARDLLDPRQSQPYTYADSALTTPAACGAPRPAPGAALFNSRLDDGTYLLDWLGTGFTLLYFADDAGDAHRAVEAFTQDAAARGLPLAVIGCGPGERGERDVRWVPDPDGRLARRYAAAPGSALLVRPDRHVCAAWATFDAGAGLGALLRATGRTTP
ncbi:MAG: FAD-dependent monooxygenase [Gammaproteobacteria bacterium]